MEQVDRLAYGVSRCRELIAVAVAQIDRDPVVCDCLVDPALEIAVANVEKIIALKRAAHRYPMAHKNAEYLAADFFVGEAVRHGASVREMCLYLLYQIAPAVRCPPGRFSKVIPLFGSVAGWGHSLRFRQESKSLRAAQFSIAEIGVLFPRIFLRFFPRYERQALDALK
jgi:hypothetical protein